MLWKYVYVSRVLKNSDKIDKSPNIGIGLKKSDSNAYLHLSIFCSYFICARYLRFKYECIFVFSDKL